MFDDFGLTVEDVMRMPFCRFMALQTLRSRRAIEERNAAKRAEWRQQIASER